MTLRQHKKTKQPNSKQWNRENLSWAAGYLDGEGSFIVETLKTYTRILICCGQHQRDRDNLEKLEFLFGGRVRGPYQPHKKYTEGQQYMLLWGIHSQRNVYAVIVALFPFLGKRRKEQAIKIIEAFKRMPGKGL